MRLPSPFVQHILGLVRPERNTGMQAQHIGLFSYSKVGPLLRKFGPDKDNRT
jgi:hypothetical protein